MKTNKRRILKNLILVSIVLVVFTAVPSGCCDDDNIQHTTTNQTFVNQASSYINFEQEAAALALKDGKDGGVQKHAQGILRDHELTLSKMKSLALHTGWVVGDGVSKEDVDQLNQLSNADYASFDKVYLNLMLKSHQNALALFQQASAPTGAPNADLRVIAAEKLLMIKGNIEAAMQCQKEL